MLWRCISPFIFQKSLRRKIDFCYWKPQGRDTNFHVLEYVVRSYFRFKVKFNTLFPKKHICNKDLQPLQWQQLHKGRKMENNFVLSLNTWQGRQNFIDLCVKRRVTLKCILKKWGEGVKWFCVVRVVFIAVTHLQFPWNVIKALIIECCQLVKKEWFHYAVQYSNGLNWSQSCNHIFLFLQWYFLFPFSPLLFWFTPKKFAPFFTRTVCHAKQFLLPKLTHLCILRGNFNWNK